MKPVKSGLNLGNEMGAYLVTSQVIHFAAEYHATQIYMNQPMHWSTSFTYIYTPIDANFMPLEDRIAQANWIVYRRRGCAMQAVCPLQRVG
jgi:hypothetical protein